MKNILNNLHLTIKFTIELAKIDNFNKTLAIKFLDITVLLHENGYVETDTFYKETNTHDYLNYDSHHKNHTKYNIHFNSAKRILLFVLDEQKLALRLKEQGKWLLSCGYPESVTHSKKKKKKKKKNQEILETFYLWYLHIFQTLIYKT